MHKRSSIYGVLLTIPDRCYPFKNQVAGQWVRGLRSYNAAVARCERRYGPGRIGYALGAYRQFFHLFGSLLILLAAGYVSQAFFGGAFGATALLIVVAMALISFQEFYWHPRYYAQHGGKGLMDWLTWCAPMTAYLFLLK